MIDRPIDSIVQVETIPHLSNGIISVCYNFGAANDEYPIGTAHFLEHVVCNLRGKHMKNTLKAETRRDGTYYYANLLTDDLHSNMISFGKNLEIDKETFYTERNIIDREIAQFRLNKRNVTLEYLQNLLFANQGYGNSILGSSETIKRITLNKLQQAFVKYRTPSSIVVIGPWEKEKVIESIISTNFLTENMDINYFYNFSGKLGRGIKILPEEETQCTSFIAGAWPIPRVAGIDQRHINILNIIWNIRIKKYLAYTGFRLRTNLYKTIGILTLDSNEINGNKDDFSNCLKIFKEPINTKEFHQAYLKLNIEEQRLMEDLQSRVQIIANQIDTNIVTSEIRLEDVLNYQNKVSNILNIKNGVYILSSNYKEETYDIYEPRNEIPKLFPEIPKTVHNVQLNKQQKVGEPPIYKLKTKGNGQYYTIVSSPLTSRFHLLLRVDCRNLGRLIVSKNIPKEIFKKGVFEYVRYEGWHAIIHLSYFTLESLKEAISISSQLNWGDMGTNEIELNKYFNFNLETEIKSKILKGFKRPPIPNLLNTPILLGKSVLIPNREAKTKVVEDLDSILFNKVTLQLDSNLYDEKEFKVNKTIIGAKFSGVAIVGKLSAFSLSCLALQEAAFGSNNEFPTLEEMVRNEGYSYRIVQSLLTMGNQYYIYWGIQCEPENRNKFKGLVINWLKEILKCEKVVEEWFLTHWSPFQPQYHRSVFQLIREVDRMGYYTQPEFSEKLSISKCVESLLTESLEEIYFEQISS
ncbi:insulinase family protein [Heyndrickxia oleronia]|uniref:insulinase family protein n=1 Tax=Heyndrickxia oleronia TaxID=38875 RepID=UPI0020422636|nr:insulinase family protein [Heyndrickxia oleronia]MCM3239544.1 insulinase family protein [Heyndrickxia oleronia]